MNGRDPTMDPTHQLHDGNPEDELNSAHFDARPSGIGRKDMCHGLPRRSSSGGRAAHSLFPLQHRHTSGKQESASPAARQILKMMEMLQDLRQELALQRHENALQQKAALRREAALQQQIDELKSSRKRPRSPEQPLLYQSASTALNHSVGPSLREQKPLNLPVSLSRLQPQGMSLDSRSNSIHVPNTAAGLLSAARDMESEHVPFATSTLLDAMNSTKSSGDPPIKVEYPDPPTTSNGLPVLSSDSISSTQQSSTYEDSGPRVSREGGWERMSSNIGSERPPSSTRPDAAFFTDNGSTFNMDPHAIINDRDRGVFVQHYNANRGSGIDDANPVTMLPPIPYAKPHARGWTNDEDVTLVRMKNAGAAWPDIAARLQIARTESAMRARYYKKRDKLPTTPVPYPIGNAEPIYGTDTEIENMGASLLAADGHESLR